jgi:hypothetical protein
VAQHLSRVRGVSMSDSFDSEIIKEQDKRIRELEAERDAIRAKTIEECAQVADDCHVCLTIAKRIRALAQTDEK